MFAMPGESLGKLPARGQVVRVALNRRATLGKIESLLAAKIERRLHFFGFGFEKTACREALDDLPTLFDSILREQRSGQADLRARLLGMLFREGAIDRLRGTWIGRF